MKRLPEDISQKLLAASEELSGTNLDVSIDEVARLADIPRATLYYYFSGKDDLLSFFLSDKLNRASVAVQKAIASEGNVVARLESTLAAVMQAMAEHPTLCTEMPVAIKEAGKFEDVVNGAERSILAPFRELLIEGKATGELQIPDVNTTAIALMGAVNMVAMFELVQTGTLDFERANRVLIPQLIQGLLPR
jgi:AcrR family transcriptional regulator